MGRKFDDPEVQRDLKLLSYKVVEGAERRRRTSRWATKTTRRRRSRR